MHEQTSWPFGKRGALGVRVAGFALVLAVLCSPAFAQIDPTIAWSPHSPDIGQTVVFTIQGVDPDIDQAVWSMGGPNCEGGSTTVTCTPTLFDDCKSLAYRYSSSGEKVAELTVNVDGIDYTAPSVNVTVDPGGSCFDEIEIYWSPFNPDIGEQVTFILSGVNGEIDQVTWHFGEEGCGGSDPNPTCIPSLFDNCKGKAFTFASGGDKLVSAEIWIDGGGPFDVGPVSPAVSFNGSCGGGGDNEFCVNVLAEPGFEGGSGSAWSEFSSNGYFLITMNRPRTGLFSAWLGGLEDETSEVWQTPKIDALATSAILQYWYWIDSEDVNCTGGDAGGVKVNGLTARDHDYDLCVSNNTDGWVESEIVDLLPFAGSSPEVKFFAISDSALTSSLYVDDVSLVVCAPWLFADGFESGNTAAWSVTVPPPI
jgi:hypothetical protein